MAAAAGSYPINVFTQKNWRKLCYWGSTGEVEGRWVARSNTLTPAIVISLITLFVGREKWRTVGREFMIKSHCNQFFRQPSFLWLQGSRDFHLSLIGLSKSEATIESHFRGLIASLQCTRPIRRGVESLLTHCPCCNTDLGLVHNSIIKGL